MLLVRENYIYLSLFFERYGDHRDLHVLTHSFPTRRSSDLEFGQRRGGHRLAAKEGYGDAGIQFLIHQHGDEFVALHRGKDRPRGLDALRHMAAEIGRASCRERVCQSVYISVVAVSLNQKTQTTTTLVKYTPASCTPGTEPHAK